MWNYVAPVAAILATLPALASASPVAAQERGHRCGERADIIHHLSEQFEESPVAIALDSRGRVLEVLASPTGGTWTMLVTMPDGMTCLMASGVAFEQLMAISHDPAA